MRAGPAELSALALAAVASGGCLARSLAVDAQAIDVTWTINPDGVSDLGCTPGRADLPLVRIRSQIQFADPDDELIDWLPCRVDEAGGAVPGTHGVITPLELGAYDVSAELWTAIGGLRLGRSPGSVPVILGNPAEVYALPIVIQPQDSFGFAAAALGDATVSAGP